MSSRVVVTGVLLVILASVLVFTVEFFLPLSMKSDMNILCRNTLLQMEALGGLSEAERQGLQSELQTRGFENITVSGTFSARQGEPLFLHVEADYTYSKLSSLFIRADTVQRMVYNKTSMCRKVVN